MNMIECNLSQTDANDALEIIHNSLNCKDLTDFNRLFEQMRNLLHFDHVRCLYGNKEKFRSKKMEAFELITAFPSEWEECYDQKGYLLSDGVALAALHNNGLIYWDDARKCYADDDEKIVADEAASFGLVDGWIYTHQGMRTSDCSIISIAAKSMKNTIRQETLLLYLLPHISQTLQRIYCTIKPSHIKLTPRELEILSWIAQGKTAWDISLILTIHSKTVEFHTHNIIKKLDAVNSQQAVATAMCYGILSL